MATDPKSRLSPVRDYWETPPVLFSRATETEPDGSIPAKHS